MLRNQTICGEPHHFGGCGCACCCCFFFPKMLMICSTGFCGCCCCGCWCARWPFLPQHAAQNPRHGRRGVVGVRQETLELHLPNLLKIGGELGILARSRDGRRDDQFALVVG